ncbi:UNVERIFIED_CONTAM: hypothetical protein PYX00_002508 [Menopon gallinae]|uniref:Venom protein n=1 Tax=Menopon gallinae TaxID=328185 RepID=A0AAW2IJ56_9NEOP
MKILILALFYLVVRNNGNTLTVDDALSAEIAKAKQRLEKDFILSLWYGTNEAIAESQDKVLKIYTQYTIEQAQNVVEHISLHKNLTRLECADKRNKALTMKNLKKLVSTLECMFKNEEDTLKAYKFTGYNLHNCIRMSQNEMEGKYLKVVENFNNIKNASMQAFSHYYRLMDNCVQTSCVLSTLFRSLIDYERLKEDVATNVTEINNLSTRYVFSHIAMGCISSSLTQISDNYEVGKNLVDKCLLDMNGTNSTNSTQGF